MFVKSQLINEIDRNLKALLGRLVYVNSNDMFPHIIQLRYCFDNKIQLVQVSVNQDQYLCLKFQFLGKCSFIEAYKFILTTLFSILNKDQLNRSIEYYFDNVLKYSSFKNIPISSLEFMVYGNNNRGFEVENICHMLDSNNKDICTLIFREAHSLTTRRPISYGSPILGVMLTRGNEYMSFPLLCKDPFVWEDATYYGVLSSRDIFYDQETLLKSQDMLNLLAMTNGQQQYLRDLPFIEGEK